MEVEYSVPVMENVLILTFKGIPSDERFVELKMKYRMKLRETPYIFSKGSAEETTICFFLVSVPETPDDLDFKGVHADLNANMPEDLEIVEFDVIPQPCMPACFPLDPPTSSAGCPLSFHDIVPELNKLVHQVP